MVFGFSIPHQPLGITHTLGCEGRHYWGVLCQDTPVPGTGALPSWTHWKFTQGMCQRQVFLCLLLPAGESGVPPTPLLLGTACVSLPNRWQELQLPQQQRKIDPSLSICGHAASLHPTGAPCSAIHAYTALLEPEKENEMQSIPN